MEEDKRAAMQRRMAKQQADYLKKSMKELVGAKIVRVGAKTEDDFGYLQVWPWFEVQMPDGSKFKIEVSQDEEGNGPGFLFGVPERVAV